MATTAQLKTRVALDLNRDDLGTGGDLEQAMTDALADAVETYATELFWFNRTSGSVNTTGGTATVALPAGMRTAIQVSYQQWPLRKFQPEDMQYYTTQGGPPSAWAENDGAIELFPVPDTIYALNVYGIADLGVPASGSSNSWTTEAYNLILNATKRILCTGPLRDPDGALLATGEENRFLIKLRRETRVKAKMPLRTDIPPRRDYFNIYRGW